MVYSVRPWQVFGALTNLIKLPSFLLEITVKINRFRPLKLCWNVGRRRDPAFIVTKRNTDAKEFCISRSRCGGSSTVDPWRRKTRRVNWQELQFAQRSCKHKYADGGSKLGCGSEPYTITMQGLLLLSSRMGPKFSVHTRLSTVRSYFFSVCERWRSTRLWMPSGVPSGQIKWKPTTKILAWINLKIFKYRTIILWTEDRCWRCQPDL